MLVGDAGGLRAKNPHNLVSSVLNLPQISSEGRLTNSKLALLLPSLRNSSPLLVVRMLCSQRDGVGVRGAIVER